MILITTVLCVVLILAVSWLNLLIKSKKFNVRGPMPLPLIGNAHLFVVKSSEFLNLLQRLSEKYGDAFLVYMMSNPYVMISHPKYIEPILSSTELITKGRSYSFLLPWLGYGLLTATGQRWKVHRKFLTPAFHFNILQNFLPVFCKNEKILREKLHKLADGNPINLFPIIALAALDNVTESIMGVSLDVQKNSESEYVKAIDDLSKILAMRMQVAYAGVDTIFNLLPEKKVQDKAIQILHSQTRKVIETRRKDLQKLNIISLAGSNETGIKNRHAFLDMLLLTEINGEKINDEIIREEVDTFMFEGHDTTTSGIVYCLYSISKNKDVQVKVLEEQRSIFGDEMDRDPTYNELHQMKYLELVIKESLRLYPAVPVIERKVTKDIDIAGLHLIQGTSITINIHSMQRNPTIYEDPLEFRPERFDNTSNKNAFHWLAFSAGPRNCIGQKFAMMELKITVAAIVKHFQLFPCDSEPELCSDLVLRSVNGVYVKMKPRT